MVGIAWWCIAPALAGPPAWEALEPADDRPILTARLSPDGTALIHTDAAYTAVHVRQFDGPSPVPPLPIPEGASVLLRFVAPSTPLVHVAADGAVTTQHWTGSEWAPGKPPGATRGFPAAPTARWSWERHRGHRWDVSRIDGDADAPTDVWRIRMRPQDQLLADQHGNLRAVGHRRERGLRYQPTGGERWRLPAFYPWADPYPSSARLERRRPSMALGLVDDTLYAVEPRDREYAALVAYDVHTGDQRVVHAAEHADVALAAWNPDTGVPDLALEHHPMPRWVALDPALEADLAWVQSALEGPIVALQRARGDRRWHVCTRAPHVGARCGHVDRDRHVLTPTLTAPPAEWEGPYPRTWPIRLDSSDGLRLSGYLVLPVASDRGGRPDQPLPTVLRIHGGPHGRASYGYDPVRTFLATRGYAVLDLNYRGSVGMGASVMTGADGERGRATQRDVDEAADWLVAEGIADPDRLALMGHSFGGFSTLLGLTRTPERYACGIALAPTAGWAYRWVIWALPPKMRQRAPYTMLDQVRAPLLLVHGTDDQVLPVSESRHVANALRRRGSPVTFLEVADGHSLDAPGVPSRVAAAAETLLHTCLDAP